jgi:hypothetical protein
MVPVNLRRKIRDFQWILLPFSLFSVTAFSNYEPNADVVIRTETDSRKTKMQKFWAAGGSWANGVTADLGGSKEKSTGIGRLEKISESVRLQSKGTGRCDRNEGEVQVKSEGGCLRPRKCCMHHHMRIVLSLLPRNSRN